MSLAAACQLRLARGGGVDGARCAPEGRERVAALPAGHVHEAVGLVARRDHHALGRAEGRRLHARHVPGAGQAIRATKFRQRLPELQARKLARRAISVPASTPLAEAIRLPWTLAIRGKGGKAARLLPDERIRTTLDAMGCEDIDLTRAPHDLSGGQAARVALARTLLTDPKVLLADEVDAGLDDDNASKVAAIMADAAAHGMAIIRIRHRPPDGRATRTLMLDAGRLTDLTRDKEVRP